MVPDDSNLNKYTTINDANGIEKHLLEFCQKHFVTAHGSPFTVQPLSTLLNYDSVTPFAEQVIRGQADIDSLNLDHATKQFLKYQQRPPRFLAKSQKLDFDKLTEGFKKWPEKTSTSPSGRHLSVYKSLLKDVHRKNDKDDTEHPSSTSQSDDSKK